MALSSIITAPSAGGGGGGGVTSIKVFTQPDITGAAVLKPGSGVTMSQSGNDITLINGAPAPQPSGPGDASKVVVANLAGSALALASTLWLAAARYNSAGQAVNDVFGTAPAQSTGDGANGQAFGARCNATLDKALFSFFDDGNVQGADLEYDGAGALVTLRGRAKGVRVTTSANDATVPLFCEASTNNLGVCGTTTFGGMSGGVSLAAGTTAPTTVSGSSVFDYNNGGIKRQYAAGGHSLFVATTERVRAFASEFSFSTTNWSFGQVGGSYAGGSGVGFVKSATTNPGASSPTGGHVYFAANTSAEPRWLLPSGAVRCALSAGTSSAAGFIASSSGGSPTVAVNKRTLTLSDGTTFDVFTT